MPTATNILERAENFYDLTYMCYKKLNTDLTTSRKNALSLIYFTEDESIRQKFLGYDAYIDFKTYQKKIQNGNLEDFIDDFTDKELGKSTRIKKMKVLQNSLKFGKTSFERLLIVKKLEDYFPLEKIGNYINSRI